MLAFSKLFRRVTARGARRSIGSRRRTPRPALSCQSLEQRLALSCNGFLTYSQGGWSGGGSPGRYLDAEFSTAFPRGVQIGDQAPGAATTGDAAGRWAALFTSPTAVRAYIPNGGGSAALGGDSVDPINPSGPTNGPGLTLGGQTLTMMLNLGFDAADPNFDGNPTNATLGSLVYTATDGTSVLNGTSVDRIVGLANAYLSGADTSSYDGATLTAALNHIIVEYDNGVADGDAVIALGCNDSCGHPAEVHVSETVWRLGSIRGRVFEDLAGDGDDEVGADPGLAWRVTLVHLGPDGQQGGGDDMVLAADALTNADGTYCFGDLAAGSYRVIGVAGADRTATTATFHDVVLAISLMGTDVESVTEGCTTTVTTRTTYAVDQVSGRDFGMFRNVSIEGVKFQDHDGNGVQDTGDQPLSGWIMILNDDGDGIAEDGEVFAATGADGSYRFANLSPGFYAVSEATPPTSWVQTLGADGYTVLVGDVDRDGLRGPGEAWSGGTVTAIDFGNTHIGIQNAKTIGFWSNKNGQALISGADLAALRSLHLRKADGGDFDPAAGADVKKFLVGATSANASNMANMLSAQLIATVLNVRHGFLGSSTSIFTMADLLDWSGNTQVSTSGADQFLNNLDHDGDTGAYEADACGNINEHGFVSIEGLIAAANESLTADRMTIGADPARAYQEALKIVFDGINNNLAIFAV